MENLGANGGTIRVNFIIEEWPFWVRRTSSNMHLIERKHQLPSQGFGSSCAQAAFHSNGGGHGNLGLDIIK